MKSLKRGSRFLLLSLLLGMLFSMSVLAEESTEETAAAGSTIKEILKENSHTDQYTNILLIGTDRRDESWNGNSDVIIVLTINKAAGKIFLTSFMRDLYADIPEYGVHKINYAYAAGGPEALMATLKDNYDIIIDNYAVVDFMTMADIIDLVGGVEITVSDEELTWLNGYLVSLEADEEDFLPSAGTWQLNGIQCVAYMRIRYVGNDYERTQRQRRVLSGMFESIRNENVLTLAKLGTKLLFMTDHDFSVADTLALTNDLGDFVNYELEECRIPYDDLYSSDGEMLVPDFEETIERLHETIYEGIE